MLLSLIRKVCYGFVGGTSGHSGPQLTRQNGPLVRLDQALLTRRVVAWAGIMLVGVAQPKPMHGFSPNFQGMFNPREFRAD